MGRGSTQTLIREIIKSLAQGSKTISEIVDETKLDRATIGKYANLLHESGLLIEDQEGTSKRFTIAPNYRRDTYFGLPLSKENEEKFNTVYFLIKKYAGNKPLLATHVQKTIYAANKHCNLGLPCGWYIHGGIAIFSYDSNKKYEEEFKFENTSKECIKEWTEKYTKNRYGYNAKQQQYEEEYPPEIYTIKEKILATLYSSEFEKHPHNSMLAVNINTVKLVASASKNLLSLDDKPLVKFEKLLEEIAIKWPEKQIAEQKQKITSLFESVWRFIALHQFKTDLSKYYSSKILDAHFASDIKQQEEEIYTLIQTLETTSTNVNN